MPADVLQVSQLSLTGNFGNIARSPFPVTGDLAASVSTVGAIAMIVSNKTKELCAIAPRIALNPKTHRSNLSVGFYIGLRNVYNETLLARIKKYCLQSIDISNNSGGAGILPAVEQLFWRCVINFNSVHQVNRDHR